MAGSIDNHRSFFYYLMTVYNGKGIFMILTLKKIVEKFPPSLGTSIKYIPFSMRLGKQYSINKQLIYEFQNLNNLERKKLIFYRLKNIVVYAMNNIYFYNQYYSKHKFNPERLKSFEDIERIPIVTKDDLKKYSIELRSSKQKGRILTNTGGTSGEPLDFYLDSSAFAREWAHMHYIWSKLGYDKVHLKLTFRGKNLGKIPIKYNPIHNEYIINGYLPFNEISSAIREIIDRQSNIYLHGYPSSIYNFACYCSTENHNLAEMLRNKLRGVLLGSEYPAPIYRDMIEKIFQTDTLSWYGHSEMTVLAYESKDKYIYNPLHSYGYCEAIQLDDSDHRLIGTSYDNTTSPFIRYDSGDLITPDSNKGLLEKFKISSGRVGEFIIDSNGHQVSLTALIFGRHHDIFRTAKFIQVKQELPGKATIYITFPSGVDPETIDWDHEFDSSNVLIDFDFKIIEKPIRTKLGKVPLLLKEDYLAELQ